MKQGMQESYEKGVANHSASAGNWTVSTLIVNRCAVLSKLGNLARGAAIRPNPSSRELIWMLGHRVS